MHGKQRHCLFDWPAALPASRMLPEKARSVQRRVGFSCLHGIGEDFGSWARWHANGCVQQLCRRCMRFHD